MVVSAPAAGGDIHHEAVDGDSPGVVGVAVAAADRDHCLPLPVGVDNVVVAAERAAILQAPVDDHVDPGPVGRILVVEEQLQRRRYRPWLIAQQLIQGIRPPPRAGRHIPPELPSSARLTAGVCRWPALLTRLRLRHHPASQIPSSDARHRLNPPRPGRNLMRPATRRPESRGMTDLGCAVEPKSATPQYPPLAERTR